MKQATSHSKIRDKHQRPRRKHENIQDGQNSKRSFKNRKTKAFSSAGINLVLLQSARSIDQLSIALKSARGINELSITLLKSARSIDKLSIALLESAGSIDKGAVALLDGTSGGEVGDGHYVDWGWC